MLCMELFGLSELYIWPRGISKDSDNKRGVKAYIMHVDFMTGPEEVYWVIMESTFVNDRWI